MAVFTSSLDLCFTWVKMDAKAFQILLRQFLALNNLSFGRLLDNYRKVQKKKENVVQDATGAAYY